MKITRNKVFETNSSSTHSISIFRRQDPIENSIPRDYPTIYYVSEYGDTDGGDDCYSCDTHNTEVSKLRFLINMIASVYEYNGLEDEWNSDKRDDKEYKKEWFNKLISQDLFVWLKEVVFEETGTKIEFEEPDNNWFPFFETVYGENSSMEKLLCLEEDENCKYDKTSFKVRVNNIIFDDGIYIENEICPYGMER